MPERARIFTLSETIARALADTPALSGRVHRFEEVRGLALPQGGLFVARLPDEAWASPAGVDGGRRRDPVFEHVDAWGRARPGADFSAAWSRFGWLHDIWPPAVCLGLLRTLADCEHPVAYYHDMERGDDLYYAFSWLAGAGEELVVEQTFLLGPEECTIAFRQEEVAPAARASALETALLHLGLAPTIQFFWPEDELPESDWPLLEST
ncbi:hypothetical protein OHS70_37875 [Streptomyces sp. NBC_00390]|uniref:hypothetical protein n=1 Tax=Streptomyces sp. NBC_00390 TaxID=2975736 RepID=UPI002E2122AF